MKLQAYPSLTEQEFEAACETFEKRCHDRLSGTDWLSLKWTGKELQICQQRSNRREEEASAGDNIPAEDLIDEDEIDEEGVDETLCSFVVPCPESSSTDGGQVLRRLREAIQVAFSITLSPTYSVPVLWLSSPILMAVDDVHRGLLADHLRESVRDVGVMGGISQAVRDTHVRSISLTGTVSSSLRLAIFLHPSLQYAPGSSCCKRWSSFDSGGLSSALAGIDRGFGRLACSWQHCWHGTNGQASSANPLEYSPTVIVPDLLERRWRRKSSST